MAPAVIGASGCEGAGAAVAEGAADADGAGGEDGGGVIAADPHALTKRRAPASGSVRGEIQRMLAR